MCERERNNDRMDKQSEMNNNYGDNDAVMR
jgi:hypothetical protein